MLLNLQDTTRNKTAAFGFSPDLEADYQKVFLHQEKILVTCQSAFLAVILYLLFGILDFWAVPSHIYAVWMARAIVIVLTLLVVGVAKRRAGLLVERYNLIMLGLLSAWGLGIEFMIFISGPSEVGRITYYAGLILVTSAIYTWTYLPRLHAIILGALMALVYLFIAVFLQGTLNQGQWVWVTANLFFLISSNVIGIFAMSARERFSRQSYLLTRVLQRDIQLIDEAKRQSDLLAEQDPLTGIPNRTCFMRRAREMVQRARMTGGAVVFLFIDLNDFKSINDLYGHSRGDLILVAASQRIQAYIRESDIAARLGGDEFVVGLNLQRFDPSLVDRISSDILNRISQPISDGGEMFRITASIGASVFPAHGTNLSDLLSAADQRMYQHKRLAKESSYIAGLGFDDVVA